MNKQSKINLISTIILTGFVLAVFFHYIMGFCLHLAFPFNTFLFNPNDCFMDFFHSYNLVETLDVYSKVNYLIILFPFSYIIYYIFSLLPPQIAFGSLIFLFLSFILWFNSRFLKCKSLNKPDNFKNIFIFTFMTYPVLFAIDRGNLEIIVFIFLTLFIILYCKEKYFLSSIFLSFAVAMKFYPIILVILYLSKKLYKEVFYTIIISCFATLLSLLILKGHIISQIIVLLQNLIIYKQLYILGNNGLAYGSSLFGAIKIIMNSIFGNIDINKLFNIYSIIAFITGGIFCYFAYIEKIIWKKTTLLIIAMLVLPHVTGDYRLLNLFIPVWLFINNEKPEKYDLFYAICFALLLIPKNYPVFKFGYTISIVLNPLIMLLIAFLIIKEISSKNNTEFIHCESGTTSLPGNKN
ncbi:MAG: glycosyltransferase family 87 protein [Candidatus Gastranaerophilales bacterium]|nr:glycosyltransferase family 87 protein [Candidatus Gastranaerophilales bacterium]